MYENSYFKLLIATIYQYIYNYIWKGSHPAYRLCVEWPSHWILE